MKGMTNFQARTFTTKAGKHVETKPHFASFNAIHNSAKTKVFILLYHRLYKLRLTTGLGVRDISLQSGVGYDYVKARAAKWCEWGYLKRSIEEDGKSRPIYVYRIDKRGKHFIEDIVPQEWLQWYIYEIKIHKEAKEYSYSPGRRFA